MIDSTTVPASLATIVGSEHLHTTALDAFALDGLAPAAAVSPGSAEAAAAVLAEAAAAGLGVAPVGGGTGLELGGRPERYDVALLTRRLDRVVEYEPADLTITVEAGLTLAELADTLARHGQFVPIEAPLPGRATVGGALARNTSGSLRTGYGSARDLLLGVRVAQPSGSVVKGGARVVKNVAGYELPKLLIGALGTLGVLTEATFKVFPLPRDPFTLAIGLPDAGTATALVHRLREQHLHPMAADLLDASAAARLGAGLAAPWTLLLAFTTVPAARARIEREVSALGESVGGARLLRTEGEEHAALWRTVRDLGHADPAASLRVKISVPPAATGAVTALASAMLSGSMVVARPTLGLIYLFAGVEPGPGDTASTIGRLRQAVTPHDGWVVVEACAPAAKRLLDVWGVPERDLGVSRRLREQFDPHRTLNPGRFVGGL